MAEEPEMVDFIKDARQMGERLGIPTAIFENLFSSDDWAFIIQAHCIVEICVNRILEREVKTGSWRTTDKQPVLNEFWSNLPLSGRSGRLTLIKKLGVVPSNFCDFIEELARIRNMYCHDARFLAKTLSEVVSRSDPNQARSVRRRLSVIPEPHDENVIAIYEKSPKVIIWLSLMALLSLTYKAETQPSPFSILLGLNSEKT